MNEFTDFLCGLLIQVGSILKIRKHYAGWLISMCSIIYWILRGWHTGFVSQTFWHCVSFTIALWGFLSWNKKQTDTKSIA